MMPPTCTELLAFQLGVHGGQLGISGTQLAGYDQAELALGKLGMVELLWLSTDWI
jgi:hypothetical protein